MFRASCHALAAAFQHQPDGECGEYRPRNKRPIGAMCEFPFVRRKRFRQKFFSGRCEPEIRLEAFASDEIIFLGVKNCFGRFAGARQVNGADSLRTRL